MDFYMSMDSQWIGLLKNMIARIDSLYRNGTYNEMERENLLQNKPLQVS